MNEEEETNQPKSLDRIEKTLLLIMIWLTFFIFDYLKYYNVINNFFNIDWAEGASLLFVLITSYAICTEDFWEKILCIVGFVFKIVLILFTGFCIWNYPLQTMALFFVVPILLEMLF